ncbi:MAG: hypothetical protein HY606_03145 [Planctomycetes bacterium]|nr:hypothetical protein [Planctomycetota bacterium]
MIRKTSFLVLAILILLVGFLVISKGNNPMRTSNAGKDNPDLIDKSSNSKEPLAAAETHQTGTPEISKEKKYIERRIKLTVRVADSEGNPVNGAQIGFQKIKRNKAVEIRDSVTISDIHLQYYDSEEILFSDHSHTENGIFTRELKYHVLEGQEEVLFIGMLSPSTSDQRDNYSDDPNLEYHQRVKLCYFQTKSFVIDEVEEVVEADFKCAPTANLTVEVFHSEQYISPSIEVRIPGYVRTTFQGRNFKVPRLHCKTSFDVPAGLAFEIICTQMGYVDVIQRVEALQQGQRESISLNMKEGSSKVYGRCVDEQGAPIKGVSIGVKQNGLSFIRTESDDKGGFVLKLLDKQIEWMRFDHGLFDLLKMEKVDVTQPLVVILKKKQVSPTGKSGPQTAAEMKAREEELMKEKLKERR